jgi:hemerythrin-like metal-binding protein
MTRQVAPSIPPRGSHDTPELGEVAARHRALLELISRLTERDGDGATKAELSALLRELRELTKRHFDREQSHMKNMACPKLDTRILIQRDLLTKLCEHVDNFEAGNRGMKNCRLGNNLFAFLRFWLSAYVTAVQREDAPAAQRCA